MTILLVICILLQTLCFIVQSVFLYALWRLWQQKPVVPDALAAFFRSDHDTHYA